MTHDEGKIYSGFRDQEILLATKFDSGYINFYNSFGYIWII